MSRQAGSGNNDALAVDFLDFIACLNERDVDFVLVGGYALGVHGVVRATADIDLLFRRTRSTVRRLCDAMHDFGAPPGIIDEEALMTPETVTQFGRPPHRIDLLNAIDGVGFTEVWNGATTIVIGGQTIRVIGLDELRKNKTAAGRPKDLEDLRRLRGLRAGRKR